MNRYHAMLCSLLLMAAMLLTAMLRQEPQAGHGAAHATHPSMLQGGEKERHTGLGWPVWLYGIGQIALITLCLTPGLKQGSQACRPWLIPLGVASLIYMAVLTALMVFYYQPGSENQAISISTVLLLVLWGTPFLFTVLYVWNFRQWVLDEEDIEKFNAIKARYQSEQSHG